MVRMPELPLSPRHSGSSMEEKRWHEANESTGVEKGQDRSMRRRCLGQRHCEHVKEEKGTKSTS